MTSVLEQAYYKVVLFGETGCGKSSIINLLADKPVANVATGADPCTKRPEWYPISLGEKTFRLWDTMGFSTEADSLPAYEQAYTLLRNLDDGVDLVLLCARHDRINPLLRGLYLLLDSFFFRGRAKIALVITKLDGLDNGWWDRNKDAIGRVCNIPVHSLPHACISTSGATCMASESNRNQCKRALEALLENNVATRTPLGDLDLLTYAAHETAVKNLKSHFLLNDIDATKLVKTFKSPTRPFHAVLLGEHGVGKSSIINLIAGSPVAEVSGEFYTRTLNCSSYQVNTGSQRFRVWDTTSLNGPFERQPSKSAIESIARLICDLRHKGEIDLLVFCKEPDWTPPWELQIFRLFREFLCESKIPVAFIITHLENFDSMEEWWENNGNTLLATLNVEEEAVAGHACITSALEVEKFQDKLSLSRQLVHAMLEDSASYSTRTLRKERVDDSLVSEEMTIEDLTNHYGLTDELAGKLFRLFYSTKRYNGWWFDERFGRDSSNCISLPILS